MRKRKEEEAMENATPERVSKYNVPSKVTKAILDVCVANESRFLLTEFSWPKTTYERHQRRFRLILETDLHPRQQIQ